jgi:hypothetical protein
VRDLEPSPDPIDRGRPTSSGRYELTPRAEPGWWLLAVCLTLLLVLLLAACGGDDSGEAVPSAGGDNAAGDDGGGQSEESKEEREQALLDWVECMRDEGVDVPDPEVDADGNMRMPGMRVTADANGPSIEEAQETCGQIPSPPGGGGGRRDESELEDAALEYAQCMRDHGIDMPDPEVDGGRVTFGGGPGGGAGGGGGGPMDQDDPAVQEAQEACEDILAGPGAGGAGSSGAD